MKFVKAATSPEMLAGRRIPFEGWGTESEWLGFRLEPVSVIHANDNSAVKDLLNWRAAAKFRGDGSLSLKGTATWIQKSLLELDDRVLFFVLDPHGVRVGHLGLWARADDVIELDNVVRNPESDLKGVMSAATRTLGRWANEFIGIEQLSLRVDSENSHAIGFYENLGFVEVERSSFNDAEPLRAGDSSLATPHWIRMAVQIPEWLPQMDKILTAGPSIGPLETCLVGEAVRTGWNNHHSDYLALFSNSFGEYVGAPYVIPTDSCTSALHLALWALGIGPGDEVIVPDVTWVATAAAVMYVGATPVFADIDPLSWCLDPRSVEEKITPATRAVIPVHLYGYVADLAGLRKICDAHGLFLVQDAAPAIGSTIDGQSIAEYGDVVCFSFQGAKLLVSGEGGVLVTRDEELYKRALKISDSGRKPGTFWIEVLGKKMKMNNPTAALALAQMTSVERQIAKKKRLGGWYREFLHDLPGISFQTESPGTRSIEWMTSISILETQREREELQKHLSNQNIDTRPVFSPISRYPIWGFRPTENPVAALVGDNSINLPSGVRLTRVDIERVSAEIRDFLAS
jgi:perosamine synthetase